MTWMKGVSTGHTGTKDVRNQQVNWHPLEKPLAECTVALVTTGGVHLRDQEPFDIQNPHGDWSYRTFGRDVDVNDLMVTHSHYNHGDASLDINCMLPIQRLQGAGRTWGCGWVQPKRLQLYGLRAGPPASGRKDRVGGSPALEIRGARPCAPHRWLTNLPPVRRTDPEPDRRPRDQHNIPYRPTSYHQVCGRPTGSVHQVSCG